MLLASCVPLPSYERDAQGYAWERTGAPIAPAIHRNTDVYLYCAFEEKAESCSVRRGDVCDIYLPKNPAPWMEAHELKHCEGWSHPNPLT